MRLSGVHNILDGVFYHITEQAQDMIFIVEFDTDKIIYANKSAHKKLGYTQDETLNLKVCDVNPYFKAYDEWTKNATFVNEQGFFIKEGRLRKKDGSEIPVEISTRLLGIHDKTYRISIVKDLSQYFSKSYIPFSQDGLNVSIINNLVEGIAIVDINSNFIFVNSVFEEVSGYAQSEILGKSFTDILHPENLHEIATVFEQLIYGETDSVSINSKIINKNGNTRIIDAKAVNLLHDPNVNGIFISCKDITDKFDYEQRLKERRRFYELIINSIPHGVWVADWDGKLVFVNDAYIHGFNCAIDKCIGKTYLEMGIAPETAEKYIKQDREILVRYEETKPYKEYIINPVTKKSACFLVKKVPITTENATFVLGIAIDITELEKTKDLLIHKNKELGKVNRELDRFLYSASHELRSPVTSIQGILNLAKKESDQDELQLYISMIEGIVNKQDKILKDLIFFTKNGEQIVTLELIDLQDKLNKIIESFSQHINYKKIIIKTNVSQKHSFSTDPLRLDLILTNIISNSLLYYNPQKPTPYIEINIKSSPNSAHFEIIDNGIGIEAEQHEKVFDMFYRATYISTGTGLGLYLAKEAVKRVKGDIKLDSTPGIGTKIIIDLPNLYK